MSDAASPAQAGGSAPAGRSGGGYRRRRRRWVAAGVVAAAVAAGVTGALGRPGHPVPGISGGAYPSSTALVTRRALSSQTQVEATLGDAGSYTVVNQDQGTITALPGIGQVVRQGEVLYQVDGSPVVLLYGPVPAYRSLSEGMTGPDVAELNADLAALGFASRPQPAPGDYFGPVTAAALGLLQARLKVTVTGALALGQAVFLPTAARITGLGPAAVPGGPAQPGSPVLSASSTTPVVTIGLHAGQQAGVRTGERVTITLPGNQAMSGLVTSVSTIAATSSPDSPAGSSAGSSADSGGSPAATAEVAPARPRALDRLGQAQVEVTITTGTVDSALVVPVDALLAQASGGYAVELTGGAQGRHLVAVSLGLFDDAAGLVQVTGPGLAAGQHVVVPAA